MFCKRRFIIRKRLQHCEVFKNTYFEKHMWAAASENQRLSDKFTSSRPEVFCKKSVLRNFAKFTVKHLCQTLLFNKVVGLGLWHRCFPVNFVKFLTSPFSIEHLCWLLLQIYRREVISNFFYLFKRSSILNFVMAEWCCHVTCFNKVYLILFFFSRANMIFLS